MTIAPSSGCGCGQRGGDGTGCGCGQAQGTGVVRDGAFTRPAFFDGQLLTADDLQALAAYTRAKDRLHNRYLVGSGVVCGLEVVCARADPASVLVRAGYALDCCGNDVVVPCDQLVDINQLVSELPHDAGCADPCLPPTKKPAKPVAGGAYANGPNGGTSEEPYEREKPNEAYENGKPNGAYENGRPNGAYEGGKPNGSYEGKGEGGEGPPAPRRYELVVEYAETATDLMAPFSTGEETSRACEPTRYREGYRFALRCVPAERSRPPSLLGALTCCAEAETKLEELEKAVTVVRGVAGGGTAPLQAPPTVRELRQAVQGLRASPDLPQAVHLTGIAVRFAAAGKEQRAEEALSAVREMSRLVRESTPQNPVAAAEVAALDEHVASLSGRLQGLKPTRADLRLAEGVVSGDPVGQNLHSVVAEARDWALCWLEQRPGTRCGAVERLARRALPGSDENKALLKLAEEVIAAVRQILIDCICAAANPPCAPCDDEAVVLAVVAVDRCEVVEICNQVRRHALTGTALRYWLPMEPLYCELEKACCGDPVDEVQLGQARAVVRAVADCNPCGWPKGLLDPIGYKDEPQVPMPDPNQLAAVMQAAAAYPALLAELEELKNEVAALQAVKPAGPAEPADPAEPTTGGAPARAGGSQPATSRPSPAVRASTTSRTPTPGKTSTSGRTSTRGRTSAARKRPAAPQRPAPTNANKNASSKRNAAGEKKRNG